MDRRRITEVEGAARRWSLGKMVWAIAGNLLPAGDDRSKLARLRPALLAEVLASPNLSAFYAGHREEFAPATDDRPFFNQVVRWTALRPSDFRSLLTGADDNVRAVPTV